MASQFRWSDPDRAQFPSVGSVQGSRFVFCDGGDCMMLWVSVVEGRDELPQGSSGVDLNACMHCWYCGRMLARPLQCLRHGDDECPLEDFWSCQDGVDVARTLLPEGVVVWVGLHILYTAEDLWQYDTEYRHRPRALTLDAVKCWRERNDRD